MGFDMFFRPYVYWSRFQFAFCKFKRVFDFPKSAIHIDDLAAHPGNYTRATSYGAAKYVKKVKYDNKTGEILTASSILDIDEDRILEEEALDGYYVLVTSEMEESDDKIIDMYRGLWCFAFLTTEPR